MTLHSFSASRVRKCTMSLDLISCRRTRPTEDRLSCPTRISFSNTMDISTLTVPASGLKLDVHRPTQRKQVTKLPLLFACHPGPLLDLSPLPFTTGTFRLTELLVSLSLYRRTGQLRTNPPASLALRTCRSRRLGRRHARVPTAGEPGRRNGRGLPERRPCCVQLGLARAGQSARR